MTPNHHQDAAGSNTPRCPVCGFACVSQEALAHHVVFTHLKAEVPRDLGYTLTPKCWCGKSLLSHDMIHHLLKHGVVEHFAECALGVGR